MRQRDVIIVEVDDELAAGCLEPKVAGPCHPEVGAVDDAQVRVWGRLEGSAIVDDDHFEIAVRFGLYRCQSLAH